MIINWSGFDWNILNGQIGASIFLEDNVYIDTNNKLHLKAKYIDMFTNYGGGISTVLNNFSFGTYVWKILGSITDVLDLAITVPNVSLVYAELNNSKHTSKYFLNNEESGYFYIDKLNTTHMITFKENNDVRFESLPDIFSWNTISTDIPTNNYVYILFSNFDSINTNKEMIIDSFSYTRYTYNCTIPIIQMNIN